MKRLLTWTLLGLGALAQAGSLPAQALARPSAQAVAAWQAQRISDIDPDGYALVDGQPNSFRDQVALYRQRHAVEALDLFHQSNAARGRGVLGLLAGPVLGAIAGNALAQSQPEQGQDTLVGGNSRASVDVGAGAALGLLVGIGVLVHQVGWAHELRAQAAESYNRQLLRELRIGLLPQPGGAVLNLRKTF